MYPDPHPHLNRNSSHYPNPDNTNPTTGVYQIQERPLHVHDMFAKWLERCVLRDVVYGLNINVG